MAKNKNNQSIWSTRIKKDHSALFQRVGSSINIDKRLYKEDIAGSIVRPRGRMNLKRFTRGPAMNPSGDIFGMDATGELEFAMPAKGGRIVKTKRGGKAVRKFGKKKKQANKMRKK